MFAFLSPSFELIHYSDVNEAVLKMIIIVFLRC